jgi:outer membrane protein assembly factor BamB
VDQYVYFEPEGVAALDPRSGASLWASPIEFDNGNHLTPVVTCDEQHLWVGSQFDSGGGRLLQINREAGRWSARQLWFAASMQASHWPLIRAGEIIYGSIGGNSRSQLTAFRWKTGEVVWKQPGYHKAQALWADGKLLFLDESGQLVLGRATPGGFEPLAQAAIARPKAWSLPTLVGSTLYVRDQEKIMALDLGRPR